MAIKIASALRTSSLGSTQWYARSLTAPVFPIRMPKLGFAPRLVILVSTVQHLEKMVRHALDLADSNDDLQVLYAAVDTIAPYLCRNGVSELWLNRRFSIDEHTELSEDAAPEKPGRVVSATQGWHDRSKETALVLKVPIMPRAFKNHHSGASNLQSIKLPLGATMFHHQGIFATCLYSVSKKESKTLAKMDAKVFPEVHNYLKHSQRFLKAVTVTLPPLQCKSRFGDVAVYSNAEKITNEELVITEVAGNLVKKINGQPAASVIQDNEDVMLRMTRDSRIFAIIDGNKRLEVVAGGGAWGARAATLALDPDGVEHVKKGSKLEFYLVQPMASEEVNQKKKEALKGNGIAVETSLLQEGFEEKVEEGLLEGVFGLGAENGVVLEKQGSYIPCDAEGEGVLFKLEQTAQ